jgi:hypothetical protein
MNFTKPIALAVLSGFILFSCKKNDTPPATPSSLLSRKWKESDVTVVIGGVPSSVFSQQQVCQVDNIYEFVANNTFSITEGTTKCSPTDPDVAATGSWALQDNNTKLSITDNVNGTQVFNLVTLTSSSLVLSDSVVISGVHTLGTLYFKPQ